jgi:hypothetical protein
MHGSLGGSVVYAGNLNPVVDATIVASEGERLVGKTVRLENGRDALSYISARTDQLGAFLFEGLAPGPWVVRVQGARGERLGEATAYVLDNALSDVTIEVRERAPGVPRPTPRKEPQRMRGGIRGRVVRGDGTPVADATITVVRGAGSAPDIAPVTDPAGRFALDGLPPGEWVFGAHGPAGERGEAAVSVTAGSVSEVVIEV